MGRQHIRGGAIEVRQQKAGKDAPVLQIPLHSELVKVIEVSTARQLTFLTTKTGKSYAPNDLSDEFRGWCVLPACPRNARCTGSARLLRGVWLRLDAARMR
jgi:hypothetical protein